MRQKQHEKIRNKYQFLNRPIKEMSHEASQEMCVYVFMFVCLSLRKKKTSDK